MRALIDLWEVIKYILHRTFVVPITEGRLKETPESPWPKGLRVLVVLTTAVALLLGALVLVAIPVRRASPLLVHEQTSLPWIVLPVFFWAVTLALSLVWVAVIHLWWPLRLVLLPAVVLLLLYNAMNSLVAFPDGTPLDIVSQGMMLVGLLLVALVRRRSRFSVWEFVVTLVFMSGWVWLQLGGLHGGLTGGDWSFALILRWLGVAQWLAAPALMLAGAAMVEILLGTASWTTRGLGESIRAHAGPRWVAGVALVALAAACIGRVVVTWGTGPDEVRLEGLIYGVGYFVVFAIPVLLVLRFAPRGQRPGIQVDPDDVTQVWSRISLQLVALLSLHLFLVSLAVWPSVFSAAVTCVLALILAVRQARRGENAAALITAIYGVATLSVKVLLAADRYLRENESVATAGLLGVAALAYLLISRKLTPERLLAVATVMFLSLAYPLREYLDDPLVALFSLSGPSAAILAGLIWRQLTEYQFARRTSQRFPVESRILIAMASLLMVTMAIAVYALSANSGTDTVAWLESLGDSELGSAMFAATVVAGLLLAVLGREVGSIYPPVEEPGWTLVEKKGLDAPLLRGEHGVLAGQPGEIGQPGETGQTGRTGPPSQGTQPPRRGI